MRLAKRGEAECFLSPIQLHNPTQMQITIGWVLGLDLGFSLPKGTLGGPRREPASPEPPLWFALHLFPIHHLASAAAGAEAPGALCVGGRRPSLKSCLCALSPLREPGEPLGRC